MTAEREFCSSSLMKRFNVLFLANIMQSAELFLRAFLSTHLVAADPSGKFRGTKEVAKSEVTMVVTVLAEFNLRLIEISDRRFSLINISSDCCEASLSR